jgi:hypothetical protein
MALALSTAVRTARAQAIIDAAGASAKIKFYNGTRPSTGGAGTTLLATLVGSTTIGTASGGVLTIGSVTQSNGSHVSGTPTWVRITTSADVFIADLSIPGEMTFTGTIATGVDITLNASTITEGNA